MTQLFRAVAIHLVNSLLDAQLINTNTEYKIDIEYHNVGQQAGPKKMCGYGKKKTTSI